jgi:aspartyl-tRNA(Asn)/glutamyl-tRNA(Gln) amidotransferase subunit B
VSSTVAQDFEIVIGLEVHLQLDTKTKIFCGCVNDFGKDPNTLTCPVCLGLPGTLPVLNKKALEYAMKVSLALNCKVNPYIKFDRKNYYYPDLPKGYQISQFDLPIGEDGRLVITTEGGQEKEIRIKRAHLEEDAGKLIHDKGNHSLVDYNRTGTPLLEIVSEPDLRSPQEAYDYLHTLKLTLQYLNVSDCDMEKGSLRCDANVSIRPKGQTTLGTKTELKNMNSFRAVKVALEFEANRHKSVVLAGDKITQETRLWNDEKQMTVIMRSKEEAHDYRYFPEPDLVPFTADEAMIAQVRQGIPELPIAKLERFIEQYKLSFYDANILVQDPALADFFEQCTKHSPDVKKICNWINGSVLQAINDRKVDISALKITPQNLIGLIKCVEDGVISNLVGKDIFVMMMDTGKSAEDIIKEKGLAQVSDEGALEKIVDDIIKDNDKVVAQVKEGKDSAIGFLVGQAMKKSGGKANPKKISDIIRRRISNV